jgi:hypothetical protein
MPLSLNISDGADFLFVISEDSAGRGWRIGKVSHGLFASHDRKMIRLTSGLSNVQSEIASFNVEDIPYHRHWIFQPAPWTGGMMSSDPQVAPRLFLLRARWP